MRNRSSARGLLAGPGAAAPAGPDADLPVRAATAPGRIISPADRSILLSLKEIPGSLFSLEALLILYMFAGMYKFDPRFAWMPVDATALFFALSFLVGSFIIVRNPIPKRGWPIIFAMLAFVVWWAVTLTWSPSKIYGPSKVFSLATLAFWGLIAGTLIIGPDRERVRRLITLILLFAIWVGIESLLIYREDPDLLHLPEGADEYRAFGSYQQIARITGLGALIALTAWLFGRRASVTNLLILVLCAMLTFVLMNTGGKGPTLATAVCTLFALLVGLRVTRRRIFYQRYHLSIIWLVIGLVTALSIFVATSERTPRSIQRLSGMIEDGEFQGTAASRFEAYQKALGFWPEAPLLGHGAGSWPILNGIPDRPSTPHNMFLEIAVEVGIVGLVLMITLLVVALHPLSIDRLRNDPLALCAFMLFAWAFMKAQLGPDIAENRTMFMLLGVFTALMGRRTAPSPGVPPQPARPLDLSIARPSGVARGRLGPTRAHAMKTEP